jgi:hypothetical protein
MEGGTEQEYVYRAVKNMATLSRFGTEINKKIDKMTGTSTVRLGSHRPLRGQ